jgi:hypothetical protein
MPEYWIVNLREGVVELMRSPEPERARYGDVRSCGRGERVELVALPGAVVALRELLPAPR